MHSCHSISTSTVWNIIHCVVPAILSLRRGFICWPDNPLNVAAKFLETAGFPCIAGCVDETHVLVNPPSHDEDAYVNRHHSKSLHVTMEAGPDYTIYLCSSRCPGRWHDSRVIKASSLWTAFEENGRRPFPGAVILGDSAYACNQWLISTICALKINDDGNDWLDEDDESDDEKVDECENLERMGGDRSLGRSF